jgi:hypothetical protein
MPSSGHLILTKAPKEIIKDGKVFSISDVENWSPIWIKSVVP